MTGGAASAASAEAYRRQARSHLAEGANPRLRPLALPLFRKALALEPGNVPVLLDMARAHWMLGDPQAALACCEEALRHDPASIKAQLRLALWQIPLLHADRDSVERSRHRYREKLLQLAALVDGLDEETLRKAARDDIVANMPGPLTLTSQVYDVREVQALYGRILCRVMAAAHPDRSAPLRPEPLHGRRIRLGLASPNFKDNSHWRMVIKGWVGRIDLARFALHCYALGDPAAAELDHVRARGAKVVAGLTDFESWCAAVRDDGLDVLIYPELAHHKVQQRMAALRLAPVQCVGWANPLTSGLPTIDYFLSGDLTEPPGAEAHYTERLVRLPNIAACLDPVDWSATDEPRAAFGLRDGAVAYLCPQYLTKCQPQYDATFARIAAAVPDSQFVFNSRACPPPVARQFVKRLERAFAAHGLDAARHVVMHPGLPQPRFRRLTELCDIFLDNIGYTGGTTVVEAGLVPGLPIVSHAGAFMRGRLTFGILRMIGMADMVADSVDAFVGLAVRLGRDPGFRRATAARIAERRDRLFHDAESIAGLESFLERAVAERAGAA